MAQKKGYIGYWKGKERSKETKLKISEKLKNKHCSPNSEFKKGCIPWNKEIKGYTLNSKIKNKGKGWINNGYKKIIRNGKRISEQDYIWMQANEFYRIPQGCVVHHINLNKLDNRIENLILLPRDYHAKLHLLLKGGINN